MRSSRKVAIGLLVPIAILFAYAASTRQALNPFYPPLGVIAGRFRDLFLFDLVPSDVVPSLENLLFGFAIAVAIGIPVGLVLGLVRALREILLPLITFGRSVPPIMLIPPMVLVLGVGDTSKLAIIAIGSVFPVILSTIDGVRQTDPALLDVSRSLRLSKRQTLQHVWIPAASPSIFGGIQIALQLALMLMVSSEMVAATRGLGFVTMRAQTTFDAPTVWAGIALLSLIGFSLNFLFMACRSRVLSWHIGMNATSKSR